ncbi:MAG: AAA family ATPase [Roseinatronobacter sp.]
MRHEANFDAGENAVRPTSDGGLRLVRYRVSNFRSVSDSGWLSLDRVTALIGVNESGKTNLLLPLWKLNPASGGEIEPIADYPKALFVTIRNAPDQFAFVTAEFETGREAKAFAEIAGVPEAQLRKVSVARLYNGAYQIAFPDFERDDEALIERALEALRGALDPLAEAQDDLQGPAVKLVEALLADLKNLHRITANDLRLARNSVAALIPEDPPATSKVVAVLRELQKMLGQQMAAMMAPDPAARDELRRAVISRLPRFVYYSNYGNLDSEIYLPHVVENMGRGDLGAKETAKARTLRVLFEFVGVQAQEILQLGRDFRDIRDEAEARMIEEQGKVGLLRSLVMKARGGEHRPDNEMLARIAEAKRTRSILLQSAGTKLTERFAEWWKQGDYRFRFEADGNHFRIWVSDARRPQEVELEHRSTGLQWFLSFFLVFLHEARGAHKNCMLLLDEPGHALHPLAQRDLSRFFEGLAADNQILYTTHSPFLVDADRLARARKVFVDLDGSTRATGDLLQAEGTDTQKGAAFAVRAALNMAVAEATMLGARPVLVQGQIEQSYLSMMKTLSIATGKFLPKHDMIFAPANSPEVIGAMARLLSSAETGHPQVLIDDSPRARHLTARIAERDRVVPLRSFAGRDGATIEDLMPRAVMAGMLDRIERRPEVLFVDCDKGERPFLQEAEAWAAEQGITLAADWREKLADRVQHRFLGVGRDQVSADTLSSWTTLLERLASDHPA